MSKEFPKSFWMLVVTLLITILLLFIFGCSPQRKLNRLIKKHPELLQADTIEFSDTIIRRGIVVREQTPIKFDTFLIEKENLRLVLRNVHDTIYVEAEVKEDTAVVEHKIPYNSVVVKELTFWEEYGTLIWIGVFLLLIIIILYLIKKIFKLPYP